MNIYIIRHAEPDYARDSLTEKGWREAELLSHRLSKIPERLLLHVSPLGRAQRHRVPHAQGRRSGRRRSCRWLREFDTGYTVPPVYTSQRATAGTFHRSTWTREPHVL